MQKRYGAAVVSCTKALGLPANQNNPSALRRRAMGTREERNSQGEKRKERKEEHVRERIRHVEGRRGRERDRERFGIG
eukprot:1335755-Amorphochlora_amoeboformis.AAC.1